jgi:hypothetical protein
MQQEEKRFEVGRCEGSGGLQLLCLSHGEDEVIPAGAPEVAVLGLFIDVVEASAGKRHGSNPAVPLGAVALGRCELMSGDVVDEIVGGLETGERP